MQTRMLSMGFTMSTRRRSALRIDVARIEGDMLDRGWNASDLARESGLSCSRVSRFLSGEHRTPQTLAKVAEALGRRPSDYASVGIGASA